MKQSIRLIAALLLLLTSSPAAAQRWREMWGQPDQYSLLEVKAAFDLHYKTHTPQKGDGYKQFQRYWHDQKHSATELGDAIDMRARASQALASYSQHHPAQRTTGTSALDGEWYRIGAAQGYGQDWQIHGVGRVNTVAFHPTISLVLYVGTPTSGIWRSINGGGSWANLTPDEPFWGVSSIVVDYGNPNKLFALTGDDFGATRSTGVYKSTDAGTNWTNIGPSTGIDYNNYRYDGRKLIQHPSLPQTLYAALAIGPQAGLYKTTNEGSTWTKVYAGKHLHDVEFHPTNPDILYACEKTEVIRSTNAGSTWDTVYTFPAAEAIRLAVSPASPNTVYAFGGGLSPAGTFPGLVRSTNSGASWTLRSNTPNVQSHAPDGSDWGNSAWWSMGLAVNPTNAAIVHVGSLAEWHSTDGGATWTYRGDMNPGVSTRKVHADCHYLAYNGNKLYYCNDGGIYHSTNDGQQWTDISEGLAITDFYRLASCEADPCKVMGGSQDNGTNVMEGPFTTSYMKQIAGGDGMDCAYSPVDLMTMFFSYQNGNLAVSRNGAATTSWITPDTNTFGFGGWVTPIMLNPLKPSTLLAGYTDVLTIYSNGQGNWVNLSNGKIGLLEKCLDVKYAPSDTNTIYVSKGDTVYRTVNRGNTWLVVNNGLPAGKTVSRLAVDPTDKFHIYASIATWEADKKVYESLNGGVSWTNISGVGELPDVPANCIVFDYSTGQNSVYLGTEAGVFYRDDIVGAWQNFSDGLPFASIHDLDIVYNVQKLRAATGGQSAWETNIRGVTHAASHTLSGPINTFNEYSAYGLISSSQALSPTANIRYTSATGVLLNTGFSIQPGALFAGIVQPCMDVPITEDFAVLPPVEAPDPEPVPTVALPAAFTVTLFPNPSDQRMTLRLVLPEAAHSRVEVFDLAMRRIASLDDQDRAAGTHELSFETGRMPAGSYLVRITAGPHMAIQRLVVQH